jgi:hypothetical protein
MKFIHFGCWNEFGYNSGPSKENPNLIHSGLTFVLDELNEYIKHNSIDFIVVAGDNYYPYRDEETGIYDAKTNNKIKTLNVDEFIKSFLELPQKIIKYILFGNHDIYDRVLMNKIVSSVKYPNLSDDSTQTCKILNLQQDLALTRPDLNYQIFNKPIHLVISNTLIIMFDSFLFEAKEYGCYEYLFDEYQTQNRKVSNLLEFQIEQICSIIKSNKHVQNIIFIAHHPICFTRTVESEMIKETNSKLLNFFNLIDTIIEEKSIYYLCADIHLYQYGIIKLKSGLTIKQYIVGTGGAHQDIYMYKGSRDPIYRMNMDSTYHVLENYNKTYGFIEFDITPIINVSNSKLSQDMITVKFIPAQVTFIDIA